MNKKSHNTLAIGIFALAIATLAIVFFYFYFTKPAQIITIHPSYPADFSDDAILMGASHNVFVGKVIAQVSTKDFVGNLATQFSVEVVQNVKGDLKDTVVINQEGGEKNGVLYLMDDSQLLELGGIYLLSTRYDLEGDYYTLNPHENASKLLSTDATLDKNELKALVDKDEKVKSLEAVYPDEKLLDADIAHNNTRNEFKSLPPEAKAAAQSRADSAKASLNANAQ